MTTKRPIATRPAPDRRRRRSLHDTTDPAHGERDHEQADARWLYAWSYDALRPTGELLAARLTTPRRPSPRQSRPRLASHSTPPHPPLSVVSPYGE
jgi:hypothetical protein